MNRSFFVGASLAALALLVPVLSHAQDEGAEPEQSDNSSSLDEAARLTFQSAREAFVAGDYETALARFRQAYELSARPGLLYNIAQTLDRLRRDEETVTALREYLEALPAAPNRAEVEARIRVLEEALARRQPAEEPDPPPDDPVDTTTTTTSTNTTTDTGTTEDDGGIGILHPAIFIAVAGLALVGGGLSVWAGLEATSANDTYLASQDRTAIQGLYDDAVSAQLLANIFIFSSAGLAAVAVVLAILTDWDALGGGDDASAATVRPAMAAGPNGGLLGLEGSF